MLVQLSAEEQLSQAAASDGNMNSVYHNYQLALHNTRDLT